MDEVIGHDVADIFDDVPIHLPFLTEHLAFIELDLIQLFFPVLPLEVRFQDRVNDATENKRALGLLLLNTENELVMESSTAAAPGLDLRLADVYLAIFRQDGTVVVLWRILERFFDRSLIRLYTASPSLFFNRDGFFGELS